MAGSIDLFRPRARAGAGGTVIEMHRMIRLVVVLSVSVSLLVGLRPRAVMAARWEHVTQADDDHCAPNGPTQAWTRVQLSRPLPADRARLSIERELLAAARVRAVEDATGVRVSAVVVKASYETGSVASGRLEESYQQLISEEVSGKIVQECVHFSFVAPDTVRVDYWAVVQEEDATGPPPRLDATLDRPVYEEGDIVRLRVRSSISGRLYLFSVGQSGEAVLVFPTLDDSANLVRAGEDFELPRGDVVVRPVLDPRLPSPQAEYLLAVVHGSTSGQLVDPSASFGSRGRPSARFQEFSFAEMNQLLLSVPRANRASAMVLYEIRPRRQR